MELVPIFGMGVLSGIAITIAAIAIYIVAGDR